ncbi:sensor histidine kinase [Jannaschia ovalis]|uniref:histidine kinase n=1 Tax=Jannaschia ovalis TaxID=3038773 RepID=A0ABY8LDG0_9RHOB|nr:HWE histidine kinase domain-containing protein [Jannaschia sp. GRR-S6-38]WGH79359.1 HWE histidine kinase domain-containing protein [Jannaschia sp. GRR-S6-38]
MRIATPETGSLFSSGPVAETDWFALAPEAGGVGRYVLDLDSGIAEMDLVGRRMTGLSTLPMSFPVADFLERIVEEDRVVVAEAIERSRETGARYDVPYRFERPDGEMVWLSGHGRPVQGSDGRTMLVGVVYDITASRVAQERAELLAGEMGHRIKNIFSLVQGMFFMAARSSDTRDGLIEAYSGRLRALADVNTLTFSGEDRRVDLGDMVSMTLGPMVQGGQIRTDLTEDFALNATAAQTVVLALNELMTNAVKHGALSAEGGTVDLAIKVDPRDFVLSWHEHAPFAVTAPEKPSGFGMRVLRQMTKATFDGDPEFDWTPTGLRFQCTWSSEEMAWKKGGRYADRVVEQAVDAARPRDAG